MDCKNILQQDEECKYQITINRQGFLMSRDPFSVTLHYGMLGKSLKIDKSQMANNERDEWYFMFPTDDMVGRVVAECRFDVPDTDYPDGYRTEVDLQYLCFVATTPLPNGICVPGEKCKDETVHYERTELSDIAELYVYLTDRRGNKFVTSDGEYLLALKKEMR